MDSNEIRSRFLEFFKKRGHKIIPSSSLVPENDSSVLFTTAGMQQFKNYYTHPESADKDFGNRNIVTVQKCVRTGDIDEVGDATHLTFFEMLGNFSFGGYWKKEAIEYAYDFITKELNLTIDYVSVFEGDTETPADNESREIWKNIDSKLKIKNHNRADNFWGPTGDEGPCGPTTEIYINGVEIWNIVFNEFYKTKEGKYEPLKVRGIDTGMGLERLSVQVQKKKNVFETDLFNDEQTREERIVADHVKASLFMISDGVVPFNTGRGYIVRRLIRRAVRFSKQPLAQEVEKVRKIYQGVYYLDDKGQILKEENKFRETLEKGLKEIERMPNLTGEKAFSIYETYGFPLELLEEAREVSNRDDFFKKMKEHQEKSRTASAGMFKGGLANHNEKTIKLHTAHHLLLAGLQAVVDKNIKQRGSNITEERLRLDFLCDHKLTDEEKKRVEDWVNEKIKQNLGVVRKEMPLNEAEKLGAEMEFGAKYPDVVSVYFIEDKNGNPISKEFCGGPHVANTSELASVRDPEGNPKGNFKILKEEAVAKGIRRIKAVLV
ncbi:MAG: alanine--tRNA ligase-related protein [Candidatus Paceibacterota bacterium]|jgi:alanyl-tRNA synthetase